MPTTYDSSMPMSVIGAMLLVRVLRRFLDLPTRLPWGDRLLRFLWVPGLVLFVAQQAWNLHADWLKDLYLVGALGTMAYVLWYLRAYRPARTLLIAGGPFLVTTLLETLQEAGRNYLPHMLRSVVEVAQVFAVIWLVVFVSFARRDKRNLEKEALLRAEEAREREISEARKAELESLVSARTAELRQQADELQRALVDLRATQTQLIQSEKMASLGELTAGIAHEIQNPLNFVNNFSEVSVELLQELLDEQAKPAPERDPELEADLLRDLVQNLEKIAHHGKRADSIVKGMLQHSRASTGQREPTDLNALADEYLRLAYHGLRAKDKTFNAQFTADLDPNLGRVSVQTQELGRVLLNLLTNAFYAVRQRQQQAPAGYQPTVTVTTHRHPDGRTEVRVRDNGTGIPAAVRDKIFQPFFTTKPTGEGTGLGLSLAYDIVTKGHGGTLAVESREGEGTEFRITLPA